MTVTSSKEIDEVKQHCCHVQVAHPEYSQWTMLGTFFFAVIKCKDIRFYFLTINEIVTRGLVILI